MKILSFILSAVLYAFSISPSYASTTANFEDFDCPDAEIFQNLISDFCWSCMFPIYIGGVKIFGDSNYAPDDAADDMFCACSGDILKGELPQVGITTSMWYPSMLFEVVAKPYCFPSLAGARFGDFSGMVSKYNQGNEGSESSAREGGSVSKASYSWHQYTFPVTEALELFEAPGCSYDKSGFMSVTWMSETLAPWYDSELAMYISPESVLFATPLTDLAMMMDCTVTTADQPMDESFWTAGCWGPMYPLTRDVGGTDDKVRNKSLAVSRALYFLTRMGFQDRTMGNDAVCKPQPMTTLKKSMYRVQQMWPQPEGEAKSVFCQDPTACNNTGSEITNPPSDDSDPSNPNAWNRVEMHSINETCCHDIGDHTFTWGVWRDSVQSSFAVYSIFKWKDCCVSFL
ncbi:TraU family protein [Vibrio penaeicida]|uniref:Conjugal transfer protein TraU n=1 Tax=Vibrio penaeicida TaxID=104609 RepID=A0AAV5NL61_9VIBR|nr:TraU family protein [Vibrio penaeicida]RTZ24619.1 hypothetical protein EKN09_02875 [Vibrio penaeicida]GLQ71119.1 conjugal transfer protein TraU [Vibrio penaeicida]